MNLGTQDVGLTISAAGTTQATATLLINGISQVTTVAASSGVILSAAAGIGSSQLVYNAGANQLKVYPPSGLAINVIAANSAHLLATNTACVYWTISATQIIATPLGVAVADVGSALSAAGTTQATATALTNTVNAIGTAAASSGVILLGGAGYSQIVYNGGANTVKVYPPVGAQINGIGTNNGMLLSTNTACTFYAVTSTLIVGVLSA